MVERIDPVVRVRAFLDAYRARMEFEAGEMVNPDVIGRVNSFDPVASHPLLVSDLDAILADRPVLSEQALAKRTGWLVLDPSSEALVRKLAGCDVRAEYGECASCGSAPCGPHGPYDVCFEHDALASECDEFLRVSAVLAALAAPGGERA